MDIMTTETAGIIHASLELLATLFVFMVGNGVLAVAVLYVLDITQTKHAIRRNYPVVGRFRYLFEHLGEFFRQYFFAMDREELTFNRAQRSSVYRAAKNEDNTVGFGSSRDLRPPGTVVFVNCPYPTLGEDAISTNRHPDINHNADLLDMIHRIREVSGKPVTPADVAWALCLGADFVVSARGFMFALGCIQALQCNRNTCPTGITTHNKRLQKGLDPGDKAVRVANYARNITYEVGIITPPCGVREPRELQRIHAGVVTANGLSVGLNDLHPDVVARAPQT